MTSPIRSGFSVGAAGLALVAILPLMGAAGTALAQKATLPSEAPPRMERLEEGPQTNLTTPKPATPPAASDARPGTTDLRDSTGAVVETQVRTPVSTYTVKPNRQVGNAQPGDLQSSGNRAAQFKLGEFGPGAKKPAKADDVPQTLEPMPGKK